MIIREQLEKEMEQEEIKELEENSIDDNKGYDKMDNSIRVKGHWIAGGNVAFPFLMALLLWYVPSRIRDFKDILKPRKD